MLNTKNSPQILTLEPKLESFYYQKSNLVLVKITTWNWAMGLVWFQNLLELGLIEPQFQNLDEISKFQFYLIS
jgi:hypothetical protein